MIMPVSNTVHIPLIFNSPFPFSLVTSSFGARVRMNRRTGWKVGGELEKKVYKQLTAA